jgi:hypothetical protein
MIRFSPSIPIPRMVYVATALGVLHLGAQAQLTCGVPNVGATVTIPPTPQPGLTEAWVDPINGNDATAVVDDATLPFLTATAALAAVSGSIGGGGPTNRGLLHLNAGIYSLLTNGETFPLVMVDWIDIQGVGAKQTILRGTPFDATISAFQPLSDPTCTCGQRVQSRVLVDFSLADNAGYAEMIDGVSFQDSDIQVYAESIQHHLQGRVSNCIFDMFENPDEGYLPPFFGILMVHRWVQDTKGDPTDPVDPPGDGEGGGPGLYRDVSCMRSTTRSCRPGSPIRTTPCPSRSTPRTARWRSATSTIRAASRASPTRTSDCAASATRTCRTTSFARSTPHRRPPCWASMPATRAAASARGSAPRTPSTRPSWAGSRRQPPLVDSPSAPTSVPPARRSP